MRTKKLANNYEGGLVIDLQLRGANHCETAQI